jgi:hypothetical protein
MAQQTDTQANKQAKDKRDSVSEWLSGVDSVVLCAAHQSD